MSPTPEESKASLAALVEAVDLLDQSRSARPIP
jgi:hypothetical protein